MNRSLDLNRVINRKFRYVKDLYGSGIPIGTVLTISDKNLTGMKKITASTSLYPIQWGGYVKLGELEFVEHSKKDLENDILNHEQNIINLEVDIEFINKKLDYMKKNKIVLFDEDNFAIDIILESLKDKKLTDEDRQKLVKKLVFET